MATTYSTKLRLAKPTAGELTDTWGPIITVGVFDLLDDAVAGIAVVSHPDTASYTLTANNGAADEARCAVIKVTGATTAIRNVVCPTQPKMYLVENATSNGWDIVFKTSAGTGISVPYNGSALVRCDGTNVVRCDRSTFGEAEGVVLGYGALPNNPGGKASVAVGAFALASNTTGYNNVAVGDSALTANTTGVRNIAIGFRALNASTTFNNSIAIGKDALYVNNAAGGFVAIGQQALASDVSNGGNNTAIGYVAAGANTTGQNNTAVGYQALTAKTSGDANTVVGSLAMAVAGTYSGCTAVGSEALYTNAGNNNTAVGWRAGQLCSSGGNNTAVGYKALQALTTGSGNVGIGPQDSAGSYAPVFNITTENNRIAVGSTATTNAYVQVAWTVVSDARDKTDFAPVPHGLEFVCRLRPTQYRYKANRDDAEGHGPLRYGFKAQDVLELEGRNPVIVDAEDPRKLRFNDQALLAVLVNAIKELREEVIALRDK